MTRSRKKYLDIIFLYLAKIFNNICVFFYHCQIVYFWKLNAIIRRFRKKQHPTCNLIKIAQKLTEIQYSTKSAHKIVAEIASAARVLATQRTQAREETKEAADRAALNAAKGRNPAPTPTIKLPIWSSQFSMATFCNGRASGIDSRRIYVRRQPPVWRRRCLLFS